MKTKFTTQDFILKAKDIHNNFYDYSKVDYKNALSKVTIICPIHGEFLQRASHHLSGHGCKKCANKDLQKLKAFTKDLFIQMSNEIHENKYDYNKVEYINARTPVTIICPKHGEFVQLPSHHLQGHGCSKCAHELLGYSKRLKLNEFIERSNIIHNNKYDYSKVKYINNLTKVCIICPEHGEFWQAAGEHLQKRGCPKCNDSLGEKLITNVLKLYNLLYETLHQVKIDSGIVKGNNIKVDFYLPNHKVIIEYNGILHYIPQEYFGGKLKFKKYQVPRDEALRKYCKENNIKLIEISYKYKDIESIENYLKENAPEIFIRQKL